MVKTETDIRIIKQIAFSPQPISAYEISKSVGKNSYSHIQKACKELLGEQIIEFEDRINERNAPKKVFRLTLRGFCIFVVFSDVFKKEGCDAEYSDDELEIINSFFERWKHLHEGIEGSHALFLKFLNSNIKIGIMLEAFKKAIGKTFVADMVQMEYDGGNLKISDSFAYKRLYWDNLIKSFLDLSRETYFSLDDIIEIFKNSSGKGYLIEEMENRIRYSEELISCYQKYF